MTDRVARDGGRRILCWSAGLISLGLAIQIVTLYWKHPIAFLVFLLGGTTLVAIGVTGFLWFLLRQTGD